MTKSQEIEILLETAAKLGKNSYCGPWLASVAEEVRSEIRSDFMPSPSITLTIKACERRIANAKAEAEIIINGAYKQSETIRQERARIVNGAIAECIRAITAAKIN